MTALNSLIDETTNIKDELVNCHMNLRNNLSGKGVVCTDKDRIPTLIEKINKIKVEKHNFPAWLNLSDMWGESYSRMPTARYGACCAEHNGKIYVLGGRFRGDTVNENQCFDVENNTWSNKANPPISRVYARAYTINDKIYSIGGSFYQNTNLCYDPITDIYTLKTGLNSLGECPTVQAINNKIYVIGGWITNSNKSSKNQCYDPITDTWTEKASRPQYTYNGVSGAIDNKIYDFGNGSYYYDTITDTWTSGTSFRPLNVDSSCATIEDKIYIFNNYLQEKSVYCYDAKNHFFIRKKDAHIELKGQAVTSYKNIIYLFGGESEGSMLNNTMCYIP